jgi:pSer/pThr/pTyr-binding forkhead associated (FHA) protein
MCTVIGRSYDCEIIIDDPLVSKKHCQILFEEDKKFYIEDIGSKNSTFLNEKVVKKKEHIIYGDRIIIGNTIMRFYLEEKLE